MHLEFVCHASVVFRRDPVHLICDPWLTGTAFDDGWALLSDPVFATADFASVTRIWLTDYRISVDYCLLGGLQDSAHSREDCDIELSSEALMFAFKFLWGGETLQINGRIPLFDYLWTACAKNRQHGALAQPL